MIIVSMPDFVDALSSYKEKLSDYLGEKYRGLVDWAGLKRKKYYLRKKYRVFRDLTVERVRVYGTYLMFDIAPYIVAYGVMINFPVSVLLGWALTVETVVSWGLVFYFVSEELTDVANELKPYIRVNAKVDN